MANSDDISRILRFWFGRIPGSSFGLRDALVLPPRLPYWGGHWAERVLDVDGTIRREFGELIHRGGRGELDAWCESAQGRLALVLLLDQMPRNAFRDTPESFAYDDRVKPLVEQAIELGQDQEFHPLARGFFYLPLMHHEDLATVDRCLGLYLSAFSQASNVERVVLSVDMLSGVRHREILRRFGRYPHRNEILGRTSTPEELRFLQGAFTHF